MKIKTNTDRNGLREDWVWISGSRIYSRYTVEAKKTFLRYTAQTQSFYTEDPFYTEHSHMVLIRPWKRLSQRYWTHWLINSWWTRIFDHSEFNGFMVTSRLDEACLIKFLFCLLISWFLFIDISSRNHNIEWAFFSVATMKFTSISLAFIKFETLATCCYFIVHPTYFSDCFFEVLIQLSLYQVADHFFKKRKKIRELYASSHTVMFVTSIFFIK